MRSRDYAGIRQWPNSRHMRPPLTTEKYYLGAGNNVGKSHGLDHKWKSPSPWTLSVHCDAPAIEDVYYKTLPLIADASEAEMRLRPSTLTAATFDHYSHE